MSCRSLIPHLLRTGCWVLALVRVSAQPVINEIHFDPPAKNEPLEFVELHNPSPTPQSLAGWRFTGGIEFTFPADATLPAQGYLVVAQNPAFLKSRTGADALGPWTGRLRNENETIVLLDAAGATVDRVQYQLGFPWPTVGTPPGHSIELIHPSLDNDLGGHWRASVSLGATQAGRRTLIAPGSEWRFFRGRTEPSTPPTAWRANAFADAAWETGLTPVGYDQRLPMGTRLTDMRNGYASVYLRRTFVVEQPDAFSALEFQALYDDGFKVWINGQHLFDVNIASGEVPHDAPAATARESADFEVFQFPIPPGLLRAGENLLAVQAHNSSISASSDFYFDARLTGITGATGQGPTPGKINLSFATNAPPAIRQVNATPEAPRSGDAVRITARVTDPDRVASVTLAYQIVEPGAYVELEDAAYETRWTDLPMNDEARDGDLAAGDGLYTAVLPASVQRHRRLIRYRITALDSLQASIRVPHADDPQPNFAYFVYDGVPAWSGAIRPGDAGPLGRTFTVSSEEMNRLPVVHLLAKRQAVEDCTWTSRYGGDAYPWTGTIVFRGRVYDHIRYRARGGVWRYAMAKNMWKFDFLRGHDFQAVDDWGRPLEVPWTKLNLGASIQQGDYNHRGEQGMFESVGFRLFRLAGVPAMHSTFVQFRVVDQAEEVSASDQYEGDFWGLYLALEQPDGRFLDQHGLPDGNFYKMEGGFGELNNLGPAGPADSSDLAAFLGSYSGATEAWWRQNFEVANYLSYQTVVQAIHHYDICYDKNFFYYLHPDNRRWQVIPWDLDLTWAENMYDSGCGGVDRIKERLLPGPTRFPAVWRAWQNRIREFRDLLWNDDEAGRLIDETAGRLRGPADGPTLLDADRAQWDFNPKMSSPSYSTSPGSKAGQGRFYQWPNYPASQVSRDFDGCLQLMKRYVGFRATNDSARARALDLLAADPAIPGRPRLQYVGASGYPADGVRFRSSAYQGSSSFGSMRWRVGEITPGDSPSWSADAPWKYEIQPTWESPILTTFDAEASVPPGTLRVGSRYRARVQVTDAEGRASQWSEPVEFTVGPSSQADALKSSLRLTEIMYHALGGSTNDFLELHNAGTAPLSLAGLTFTSGIDYTFPAGTTLPAGGYLVLTKAPATGNYAAFRAFYGLSSAVFVLGPYDGNLSDAGESLVLGSAAGGGDLISVTYGDGRGWPVAADGAGASLVPRADFGPDASSALDYGGNWRASTWIKGSPGRADPEPDTSVVLNELVAHTDFLSELDSNDWIELYNRADTNITLGAGWYLSDDSDRLTKWAIPASTQIPARGWVAFDEITGFNNPRGSGFGLDKAGEQVFLSHFPAGTPGRVVDAISFKGQENDWALARVPDGGDYWDAVLPRTRASLNGGPPPRVAISELLYHEGGLPTNAVPAEKLEFIELYNEARAPVNLYSTYGPWQLVGAVDFAFPVPTVLGTGERILVVPFNPATEPATLAGFRQTLSVPAAVRIFGPYTGRLDNDTERLALERPQAPDVPGEPISWVVVDEVYYHESTPWPGGADGVGRSYQRREATAPGNNPANWFAATPTPGTGQVAPNPDRDQDGLPNDWETSHGLNPDNPADARQDPDGDGLDNLSEYLAGTDPRDADSALRWTSVGLTNDGVVQFRFEALAGRAYAIESGNPADDDWRVEREIAASAAPSTVIFEIAPTARDSVSRLYRIRLR